MFARLSRWQPGQSAAVVARAVGALALAALAVIHVVGITRLQNEPGSPTIRVSSEERIIHHWS